MTILRKEQVRKKGGCLYEKVATRLREEIGELRPGDVLASQRELAKRRRDWNYYKVISDELYNPETGKVIHYRRRNPTERLPFENSYYRI